MATNRKPYTVTKGGDTLFGQRLRAERIRRGFQVQLFADKCDTHASQITGYENRNVMPSVKILIKMAQLLDCSTDWLLGLED